MSFAGVGSGIVEEGLTGSYHGKEVTAVGEWFNCEQFLFYDAVEGFHVTLASPSARRVCMSALWDGAVGGVIEILNRPCKATWAFLLP